MATQKVPIVFVDTGSGPLSDATLAGTAPKTGRWQFPAYMTKSVFGIIKIPDDLAGSPNPKIEVIVGGGAILGGASIDVGMKVFDEVGTEYGLNLLVYDSIQDFSVPVGSKQTKKLTFAGGDLANVAAGKYLWVEVRRLGGCGRLANEADIELIGADLSIDLLPAGVNTAKLFARTAMGI